MKIMIQFFVLFSLLFQVQAQETKEKETLFNSIKEIYVKGSVADESLFLVLGFENAHRFAKQTANSIMDKENLVDIGKDVADTFSTVGDFYSKDEGQDDSDYTSLVKDSAKFSKRHLGRVLSSPWKSLSKIPQSFKVGFERAEDSLNNSSSALVGSTKWAGHAVWTMIKGSYYLVIETPAVFVGEALLGSAALPLTVAGAPVATLGYVTLRLGWETVQLSYEVTRAIIAASASVLGYAYAAISTTVASSVVILGAATMATARGAYTIVSYPFKAGRVANVKVQTEINYKHLEDFANDVRDNINSDLLEKYNVDSAVLYNDTETYNAKRYYSAKLVYKAKDSDVDAFILKIGIDFDKDKTKQFINVEAFSKKKHLKTLANRSERKEKEEEMRADFELVVTDLIEKFSAGQEEE